MMVCSCGALPRKCLFIHFLLFNGLFQISLTLPESIREQNLRNCPALLLRSDASKIQPPNVNPVSDIGMTLRERVGAGDAQAASMAQMGGSPIQIPGSSALAGKWLRPLLAAGDVQGMKGMALHMSLSARRGKAAIRTEVRA
jgi:hypothetical protein